MGGFGQWWKIGRLLAVDVGEWGVVGIVVLVRYGHVEGNGAVVDSGGWEKGVEREGWLWGCVQGRTVVLYM